MENIKKNISIGEDTIIVSIIDSLISMVFSDNKTDENLFHEQIIDKMNIVMPKNIETNRDILKTILIQCISSFCNIEDIEIKAMQKLVLINKNFSKIDYSQFEQNEETLNIFLLGMLPLFIDLEINIAEEFAEIEGLRTHLLLKYNINCNI